MTRPFRVFLIIIALGLTYFVVMEYVYPNTPYCKNAIEKIASWEYTEADYQCGGNIRIPGCVTEREKLLNRIQSCKYGAKYPLLKFNNTGQLH